MRQSVLRFKRPFNRGLAGLLFCASGLVHAGADGDPFRDLLETSLKERKGVTCYVNGQTVQGRVTRMLGEQAVELTSREYGRIVIRLDRIDAVAGN